MILNDHFEALEADFQAHYGLDLRVELVRTGARRLYALMCGLPPHCALHRALDPTGWQWDTHAELLATIAEVNDIGNRIAVKINSKPGTPEPPALHIPRPDEVARSARPATAEELAVAFAGHIKKG